MKLKTILFLFLAFAASSSLHGQIKKNTGLIFNDSAYDTIPHLPKYSGKKYDEYPLHESLRDYCPKPIDQGNEASCVGWACGYGALTISKAIKLDLTDQDQITKIAHSAKYIYNQTISDPSDCNSGSPLPPALKLLKEKGDCLEQSFSKVLCSALPSEAYHKEASKYKIRDYAAIFNWRDPSDIKIKQTIKSIANKKPVVIGMNLPTSFFLVESGQEIWEADEDEKSGIIGDQTGHAMVVIGYDLIDSTFEVMNSFGADWGEEGFIRISFNDFTKFCRYAFQMILDDNFEVYKASSKAQVKMDLDEDMLIHLAGTFEFVHILKGYEKDEFGNYLRDENNKKVLRKEKVAVNYDSKEKLYKTERAFWKVGNRFQLVTKNIPEGKYVYVFSIDATNNSNLHWPKSYINKLNIPSASYIPDADAEIIIPSERSALAHSHSGEDFLCVIYSDKKLSDIQIRIGKVKNAQGAYFSRLNAGFKDILIKPSTVDYEKDNMSFESLDGAKAGVAVAIMMVAKVE